ncbi:MAG: DUF927 domain-containing protein [Pseudomonadota bacterium]
MKTSVKDEDIFADAPPFSPEVLSFPAPDKDTGRPMFIARAGGIYAVMDRDAEDYSFLCPPIEVEALTRSAGSENWGRLVSFKDPDGVDHQFTISMADVSADSGAEVIRILARHGFAVPMDRKRRGLLLSFLASEKPTERFRCVERLGWSEGTFVLPGQSWGPQSGDPILWQPEGGQPDHAFVSKGSLAQWQQMVALVGSGNLRLIFALSAAFAGPLIDLFGEESGGVHFRGSSSCGKTTALHLAASVWGGEPSRFIKTWRATDNALESIAATHCDTLLCLDELGQASAPAASAAAYMLANGAGKARASRTGSARKLASWRTMFLSTGELSLADKIREEGRGRSAKAGQEVRILDIAADAGAGLGIFDTLNDEGSGAALSERIKLETSRTYGTAGPAFVGKLVEQDRDKLVDGYRQAREAFIAEVLQPYQKLSGQVRRAAARFALIAAAGEMAIGFGVLPFDQGTAKKAATRCFEDWLRDRGGSDPAEVREGIERVRAFVTSQPARFQPWGDDFDPAGDPPRDLAGYRRTGDRPQAGFYILPAVFKGEVCRGLDIRVVADALIERELLVPGADGKSSGKHKPPASKNSSGLRLYHVKPAITDEQI